MLHLSHLPPCSPKLSEEADTGKEKEFNKWCP